MPAIPSSPSLLLRALPEAELEALGQRLELVELVEETILVEAGRPPTRIYLPYSGAISIMVRLSGGQTVEVATIGRDSIFGAAAALDGGQSLTSAFVVLPCPARPRCSTLRIFGSRPSKRHFPRNGGATRAGIARNGPAIRCMQCIAPGRSTSVTLAVACMRSMRRRRVAAYSGSPGIADWRATQRDFDCRSYTAAGANYPLQPGFHRYCRSGRPETDGLRML